MPARSLVRSIKLSVVQAGANHAQEEVRAVVLDVAAQDLLIDWDRGRALDVAERVDGRSDAKVADTLDVGSSALLLTVTLLTVLDRNLREPNTDGTDVATQNITTVQSLPSPNSIIEALEVDYEVISLESTSI